MTSAQLDTVERDGNVWRKQMAKGTLSYLREGSIADMMCSEDVWPTLNALTEGDLVQYALLRPCCTLVVGNAKPYLHVRPLQNKASGTQ